MKRVKKRDLEELLATFYMSVESIPISDFINGTNKGEKVQLDINSVCIYMFDRNKFEDVQKRKEDIKKFAKKIEDVTFGNLKVVESDIYKVESDIYKYEFACLTSVVIANAYEVEGIN